MSEELKADMIELGLQRYVSAFMNAGYDDWDAVGDMTESDFDALDIRLGDRRKLQREIARRQFWPENSPLPTPDELREFTLSLQENGAEEAKTGVHHHISEALDSERISPDIAESPALAASSCNVDEGPVSVSETSQSSDTIPTLELNAEVNSEAHDIVAGTDHNRRSLVNADFDDDDTPRALENPAPLFE